MYGLSVVCMFPHWTETFPCKQAARSPMAKVLWGKIIPTWETPLELRGDQKTHFSGQVLQQVDAVWLVYNTFTEFTTHTNPHTFSRMHQWHYYNLIGNVSRNPSNTLAQSIFVGPSMSHTHQLWNS